MTNMEKTRENRLRRKLGRMGYRLARTRRKDPDAIDYGKYAIIDAQTNCTVAGTNKNCSWYEFDLDDTEKWIKTM
jgi:hypothetical protein